jgi:hypothetical protein
MTYTYRVHGYRSRNSSNIKGITSTIWEAVVLELLRRGIYDVHHWNGLRWHAIYSKFHNNRFRYSHNTKAITSTIWEAAVLVLLMRGIYDVHHWDGLRWHDIVTCLVTVDGVLDCQLDLLYLSTNYNSRVHVSQQLRSHSLDSNSLRGNTLTGYEDDSARNSTALNSTLVRGI